MTTLLTIIGAMALYIIFVYVVSLVIAGVVFFLMRRQDGLGTMAVVSQLILVWWIFSGVVGLVLLGYNAARMFS